MSDIDKIIDKLYMEIGLVIAGGICGKEGSPYIWVFRDVESTERFKSKHSCLADFIIWQTRTMDQIVHGTCGPIRIE